MNLTELKSKVTAHENLTGELPKLETLREKTAADLAELSANCDLADETSLLKVARLQLLAGLLPARIEALQKQHEQSAKALTEFAGEFVSQVLRPKISAVRAAAAEKIKKVLAPHFSNADQLMAAVNESDLLTSINSLYCTRDCDSSYAIRFSRQVVDSFESITKIEKTL